MAGGVLPAVLGLATLVLFPVAFAADRLVALSVLAAIRRGRDAVAA